MPVLWNAYQIIIFKNSGCLRKSYCNETMKVTWQHNYACIYVTSANFLSYLFSIERRFYAFLKSPKAMKD